MKLKKYVSVLLVAWTLVIIISLSWNLINVKHNMMESALTQARIAFEKDILYRRWASGHEGVYVPVTKDTPPNPYLEGIVIERDITTLSGRQLTLMNPAYMTRQIYEFAKLEYNVYGHITSLDPIRPENAPDPWETGALKSFETGKPEVSSVEMIDGQEYLRFMRPLITESRCLKCHSAQGYKEGDIRGGISVSVPMLSARAIANGQKFMLSVAHAGLWLAGLIGLFHLERNEEKYLRESIISAEEWKNTFNAISDLVSVHDKNFRILKVNKAFADFFGKRPEEFIGKYCYEVVHQLYEPIFDCPHALVLKSQKTASTEIYDDNTGLHFMITVSPVFENGELKRTVHTIRDITKHKQAEEDLKARTNELEKINKAFVGRELKMKELKEKIGELEKGQKS